MWYNVSKFYENMIEKDNHESVQPQQSIVQNEMARIKQDGEAFINHEKTVPGFETDKKTEAPIVNMDLERSKDKKKKILIGSVGGTAVLGVVLFLLLQDHDNTPPPPPQPTAQPTILVPATTTRIPEPTATATSVLPTATATQEPVPTPLFTELQFFQETTLSENGATIWLSEYSDAEKQFPNAGPNELNDIATAASRDVLTEKGKTPAEACNLPVGFPYKKAGPLTLEAIAAILEDRPITFAPELNAKIRKDVLITAGADLSCNNNRTDTDPAYKASLNVNTQLKALYNSKR